MLNKKYFSLNNKLVLITGASSGIGQATAKAFANKKTKLALTARNRDKLKKIKKDLSKEGVDVEIFPFDLLKIDDIPELIHQIEDRFNDTVDILINSAGIAVLGMIENVPIKAYKKNLQLNFFAPLSLIRAVLPKMKEKKSGQIINLFSGVGKRGLPGISSYCVSKFALNGLTDSLRVEASNYNIDVILFSPGLVKTNFNKNLKIYGNLKETFTRGRLKSAKFVAEKIVRASIRRKREVILSYKTIAGVQINYWFPSLLDRILKKKL